MLECLSHMAEYDECGAEYAEKDIWEGFAKEAGVSVEELKRAYAVVTYEGYYGPGVSEEWEESGMSVHRGVEILSKALQHIPDIRYTHPDVGQWVEGEEGEEGEWVETELVVDPEEIRRSCFPSVLTIYGSWL